MNLDIHPPLPARNDFRIGILGSGFIVSDSDSDTGERLHKGPQDV
jgi:hypothetical protein